VSTVSTEPTLGSHEIPVAPGPHETGWLSWYDLIVIQTSAGKDSQTAMRTAMAAVREADAMDRVAALHLDLGGRVEWPQVPDLAAEQAVRHGLARAHAGGGWAGRVHLASRPGGDLLDDVATRRRRDGSPRGWPTMWTRYCTSDHKTAVGRAFTEAVCEDIRTRRRLTRPVRVLQVMGLRAAESNQRAARPVFSFRPRLSALTKRHVFEWLPIHAWSTAQVWADIRAHTVPYHPVYDEAISRLSCRHCVLASLTDLAISKRLSPHTAADYQAVEATLGDPFRHNRPLASIKAQPGPPGFDAWWLTCPTCGVAVLANTRQAERFCPAHAATGPWDRRHPERPGCAVGQEALFDLAMRR
jgi:3'-phosphoadenosine 5'-phosphosulfate sulfotransferase (PAPS reductase)/FAD synthetase